MGSKALAWGHKQLMASAIGLLAGAGGVAAVWGRLTSTEAVVLIVCMLVFVLAVVWFVWLIYREALEKGRKQTVEAMPPRTDRVLDATLVSASTVFVRSRTIEQQVEVCLQLRVQGISDVSAKPIRFVAQGAVHASGGVVRFAVDFPIVSDDLASGAVKFIAINAKTDRYWSPGGCVPAEDRGVLVGVLGELTYSVPVAGFQILPVHAEAYVLHRVSVS